MRDGGSVNAERYLSFLSNAFDHYSERYWQLKHYFLLMHDNARPHVAQVVNNWLASEYIERIKQPPYSPDANLMDRFIFRNFKTFRRNKHFSNVDEVVKEVDDYIATLLAEKLSNKQLNLKNDLPQIIDSNLSNLVITYKF